MSLTYEGNVAWVFPDNFDVDLIVGVHQIKETNVEKLMEFCMKEYDENFVDKVKLGDMLVAGKNFGYGHPHFQGMAVMRKLGISAILAESFSPGFFRSEIVTGVAFLTVPKITQKVKRGDKLVVSFEEGKVMNVSTGESISGVKPSEIVTELVKKKSLMKFIAAELEKEKV